MLNGFVLFNCFITLLGVAEREIIVLDESHTVIIKLRVTTQWSKFHSSTARDG
jgi:hypothetical protein